MREAIFNAVTAIDKDDASDAESPPSIVVVDAATIAEFNDDQVHLSTTSQKALADKIAQRIVAVHKHDLSVSEED